MLVGTLVDGDGHALPRLAATPNWWWDHSVSGGGESVTDHEGRFRWELAPSFVQPTSEKRIVGLVGAGRARAVFDARRAFCPGVHDIGDVLYADPADPRALLRLSNEALLTRMELLAHWSTAFFDACLRECVRRGGNQIVDHLAQLEKTGRSGSPLETTDIPLATAVNRAARLADPLELELVLDRDGPIECVIGHLPVVRVAFINRDPRRRTLKFHCSEPDSHDVGLAVDCRAVGPGKDAFRLLRSSHEGLSRLGDGHALAPGEEVVVPIDLSHYVSIESAGRYELRIAFRQNGYWTYEDQATELPTGVLFTYSKPFLIEVAAAKDP